MIYTKTGDEGMTSLPDGTRVAKNDPRIVYYGLLDELNAQLGWLRAQLATLHVRDAFGTEIQLLVKAQRLLFSLRVEEADIVALEHGIDDMDKLVGGLFRGFILPGGHPVAAAAHVVRSVCRRIERELYTQQPLIKEKGGHTLPPKVMVYLNRLSDFIFALARKINLLTDTPETLATELKG